MNDGRMEEGGKKKRAEVFENLYETRTGDAKSEWRMERKEEEDSFAGPSYIFGRGPT